MSSKNLRLYKLLSRYNSYLWDIVRAYEESGMSEKELMAYLVENEVNLRTRTILLYKWLYGKIKSLGYSDKAIDKRTPSQWMEYLRSIGEIDDKRKNAKAKGDISGSPR